MPQLAASTHIRDKIKFYYHIIWLSFLTHIQPGELWFYFLPTQQVKKNPRHQLMRMANKSMYLF